MASIGALYLSIVAEQATSPPSLAPTHLVEFSIQSMSVRSLIKATCSASLIFTWRFFLQEYAAAHEQLSLLGTKLTAATVTVTNDDAKGAVAGASMATAEYAQVRRCQIPR